MIEKPHHDMDPTEYGWNAEKSIDEYFAVKILLRVIYALVCFLLGITIGFFTSAI